MHRGWHAQLHLRKHTFGSASLMAQYGEPLGLLTLQGKGLTCDHRPFSVQEALTHTCAGPSSDQQSSQIEHVQGIYICLFRPKISQLDSSHSLNRALLSRATLDFRDDVEVGLSISMHLSQALLVQANMLASRKMSKSMAVVSTLRTVGKRRDNM